MTHLPGFKAMAKRHLGPRAEYRQQERRRADNSASIAERFPDLKSLTAELGFQNPEGGGGGNLIRYSVNISNAKSVFRFDCPNVECIGGDFDLSAELTDAVAEHRSTAVGEFCCQGWRSKATVGTRRCQHKLWYRLTLGYHDLRQRKDG
jgi:hypothetical protein